METTLEKPTFTQEVDKDINAVSLYGGKVKLCFDHDSHHYTVDGKTVDGVTSILGVIAKPALVYWAAGKASEYIDQNLTVGEVVDELKKKQLVDGCKTAHRTALKNAGDHGTILHSIIEAYIKKQPYKEPTNPKLKESFDQFRKWVTDNEVEFVESERRVYSKANNYAGCLDFVARIKGKIVIGDLKTSSGIWAEYHFQTAAYKAALMEENPGNRIDHTVIIRCGKDGAFEVAEMDDHDGSFSAFLGALQLYRRLNQMKRDLSEAKWKAKQAKE